MISFQDLRGDGKKLIKKLAEEHSLKESENSEQKASGTEDKLKSLIDKLGYVDDKYSVKYLDPTVDIPSKLDLTKLDYKMPDEDSLLESARKSLEVKYGKAKSQLVQEKEDKSDDYEQNLNAKMLELSNVKNSKAKCLAEAKENIHDRALRNGIARGSIKGSLTDKAASDVNDEYEYKLAAKQMELDDLNGKISKLTERTKEALQALSENYSEEVMAKTQKLLSEALAEQEKVTKYNNSVDEKQANYADSVERKKIDAVEKELKRLANAQKLLEDNGETGLNILISKEKANLAKAYLLSIPQGDAIELLSNAELKKALGSYYNGVFKAVSNFGK